MIEVVGKPAEDSGATDIYTALVGTAVSVAGLNDIPQQGRSGQNRCRPETRGNILGIKRPA